MCVILNYCPILPLSVCGNAAERSAVKAGHFLIVPIYKCYMQTSNCKKMPFRIQKIQWKLLANQ